MADTHPGRDYREIGMSATAKYIVELTARERAQLEGVVKAKRMCAKKRIRAQVLLKVDEGKEGPGWSTNKTAEALDVHPTTVKAVRKKFVLEGFDAAFNRQRHSRPGRDFVIGEQVEETLVALATAKPPKGHARWTLRLLADRLVELRTVEAVSHETVRKALKKMSSRCIRWRSG